MFISRCSSFISIQICLFSIILGPLSFAQNVSDDKRSPGSIIDKEVSPDSANMGTPLAIEDGQVYFGGNAGPLHAVNTRTWKIQWRYPNKEAGGIGFQSPIVEGGKVYSSTRITGVVLCLDQETGEELWTYDPEKSYDGYPSYTPPALVDGRVYVGGKRGIHCLDAETGELIWRKKVDHMVYTTPAVSDGIVVFGSGNTWYAVNAKDGTLQWKKETPDKVYGIAIYDGRVFLTVNKTIKNKELYALDLKTGKQIWTNKKYSMSTLALVADKSGVYCTGIQIDDYEAGEFQGFFIRFDWDTGNIHWKKPVPMKHMHTSYQGTPLVSKKNVYWISNRDKTVYALRKNDGKTVFETKVGGRGHLSAVLEDGKLYVGADQGKNVVIHILQTDEEKQATWPMLHGNSARTRSPGPSNKQTNQNEKKQ